MNEIVQAIIAMHDRSFTAWRVPPILEELKQKAKAEPLWNLFLPVSTSGPGLTHLEYAPLREIMGRVEFAPEVFNCRAPDTGNMELLERHGRPNRSASGSSLRPRGSTWLSSLSLFDLSPRVAPSVT